MTEEAKQERVSIEVLPVSGPDVEAATERLEGLADKYTIAADDMEQLFQDCVSIFVRNRIVYGESGPEPCSLASCGCGAVPAP